MKHHLKKGEDERLFYEMLKEENVVEAPADVDDDWFILKFAIEQNSLIISNDLFRDYQEKYPQYGGIINKITVKYSFIGKGLIFGENLDTLISSLI